MGGGVICTLSVVHELHHNAIYVCHLHGDIITCDIVMASVHKQSVRPGDTGFFKLISSSGGRIAVLKFGGYDWESG